MEDDKTNSEIERESESYMTMQEYINSIFDETKLRKMRESIAYVYIRAHSSLPYNVHKKYKVDRYTMPNDMNLTKISAVPNGESNYTFYDYADKKQLIMSGIRVFNEEVNKDEYEKNDSYIAAAYIASKLKLYEKNNKIINFEQRNQISKNKKGTVLNKIITPFSKEEINKKKIENYIPVQLLFFDESEFESINIYPLIHEIYRGDNAEDSIIGDDGKIISEAIKIAEIIKFLDEFLQLKNVVLIDFTCSSTHSIIPDKDNFIRRLNYHNLHGGIKMKKYKKTKKYKKKKTKNTIKKTKKYKKNNKK
jgi:hypothetical protein